jgi:two-component system, NarL family, response regulator NreC
MMPDCDGITAARTILRVNTRARVVFVTVHDEPDFIERGLAVGALGYVLKHSAGDELVPAEVGDLPAEVQRRPQASA